ncbi:unnamed protein product [Dovyalis caffra]|uniref:Protein kinase domain-containing protein n=1 Tax=Dovyalis caffra TaxID=77055 RepID=A0AAV1RD26_9ROSI|nr:unnamed protein product [Dovyalis caffra]
MALQRLGFTSSDILAGIKESNVISMGATGGIYKVEMPQLDTVVAVKKLQRSGTDIETGSSNNFVGEVNLLGNLRHQHIVKLSFLHNDSDMMARVADFGLARMMLRKNKTVSMVAGSYEYIPLGKEFANRLPERIFKPSHASSSYVVQSWQPPAENRYKINSDAAIFSREEWFWSLKSEIIKDSTFLLLQKRLLCQLARDMGLRAVDLEDDSLRVKHNIKPRAVSFLA